MIKRVALLTGCLLTLVIAGCSLGPPDDQPGDISLTVTRDFGAKQVLYETRKKFPDGETVMRYTQREAPKVETRYGGRFISSIDGITSSTTGNSSDWFYYVNGIEADVGAAESKIDRGDQVWWDYHDWDETMRVPAVVGSFPEPFAHGEDGKRYPIRIDCGLHADSACDAVEQRIANAGITVGANKAAIGAVTGENVVRFVVGTWDEVRQDPAAKQLEDGPDESGVFAKPFATGKQWKFALLDQTGATVDALGSGGGLVAATRFEKQAPTWVVTGPDRAGVDRAVALLTKKALRNHFAVATNGKAMALPVGSGE